MANQLERGADHLAERMLSGCSAPVTYRRDALRVSLPAVIGDTLLKLDDGFGGFRMVHTDRDFSLDVATLEAGGVVMPPLEGDMVEEADGRLYDLLPIPGEHSWRWADEFHKRVTIHTKEAGS
jgi:hypothetical protein